MLPYKIAVETGLSPVKQALRDEGYHVIDLAGKGWMDADVVVVSGQDEDFLNMQDPVTSAPVISAQGMTPREITRQVKEKLDLLT